MVATIKTTSYSTVVKRAVQFCSRVSANPKKRRDLGRKLLPEAMIRSVKRTLLRWRHFTTTLRIPQIKNKNMKDIISKFWKEALACL